MSKFLNSNSQIMALQTVTELDAIQSREIRTSGFIEACRTMDSIFGTSIIKRYDFDVNITDYKVFSYNSIKAKPLGFNQSLIGETVNKLAYTMTNGGMQGEYYAGIFAVTQPTTTEAEVIAMENEMGKESFNQAWVEVDQHLMGTIYPTLGQGKKLNNGFLDIITDIDNTVITGDLTPDATTINNLYRAILAKQVELNTLNNFENFERTIVLVSGAKMQSLFKQPRNVDSSNLSTLSDLLSEFNIFPVYLSNRTDTRDYVVVLSAKGFEVYIGNEPSKLIVAAKKQWRDIREVYYIYNNPFIIPTAYNKVGSIINGGSNGLQATKMFATGTVSNPDINFTLGDENAPKLNKKGQIV